MPSSSRARSIRWPAAAAAALASLGSLVFAAGERGPGAAAAVSAAQEAARADDLLVVDCLLPGQIRRLGQQSVYVSARRPARLSARDCQIRGGEYVAYDRADIHSALAAWLPAAERGDVEARTIVGEIYERGLGTPPDYAAAARWYGLAADAGGTRAQINLGHLYEQGLGVPADARAALQWYRRAAGLDVAIELDAPQAAPPPASAAAPGPAAVDERAQALEKTLQQREAESAALAQELAAARVEQERTRAEQERRAQEIEASGRETAGVRAQLEAERARSAAAAQQLELRAQQLDAQRLEIKRLGGELASAQALAARQREQLSRLAQPVQERLLAGPKLTLVEPQLLRTRDIVPVALAQTSERELIGRVVAPAGIVSVTVNDAPVRPNELGVFTTRVPLPAGDLPVTVVAVDRQGKRGELRFTLRATAPASVAAPPAPLGARASAANVDFGAYHALVIGDDDYQSLQDLTSPVADATELAAVLERRYGFRTTLLLNATRYEILSALNRLRETLTARDNLLVYFAGHGELDEVNQRGHWLPVDAERDSTANWIPTTAVTDILNIMQAKHVLVIVDSCYAGALTRSSMGRLGAGMTDAERLHWMRTMVGKRSRTVLTSGGLAPVMDAGGGRHSVFARALLEVLDANVETIDGEKLHREVAARVAYAAANLRFDQVPEYAPIRFAGHEAGEFFLLPR